MRILISKSDFCSEVNRLASGREISKGKIRELLSSGLGIEGENYLKVAASRHTGFGVKASEFLRDLEQSNLIELEDLEESIVHALNCNLSASDKVDSIGFIDREIARRRRQYLNWDHGYPLASYLLLLPYLLGVHKSRPSGVSSLDVHDWHIQLCVKSVVERYYRRFKLEAIGSPFFGDEVRRRKAWLCELGDLISSGEGLSNYWEMKIAESGKFANTAENFIWRNVVNDIVAGGDGSFLFKALKDRLDCERDSYPLKNESSNPWGAMWHMPDLTKEEYAVDCVCEIPFLCCSLPDEPPLGQLSKSSFPELSFRYPIVLSDPEFKASVRLSREDLSSGLYIDSTNSPKGFESTLLAQIISQGKGLVYVVGDGLGFPPADDVGKIATRLGRASEIFALTASNIEGIRDEQLLSVIVSGGIVLVDISHMTDVQKSSLLSVFDSAFKLLSDSGIALNSASVESAIFVDYRHIKGSLCTVLDGLRDVYRANRLWHIGVGCSKQLSTVGEVVSPEGFGYSLAFSCFDGRSGAELFYRGVHLNDEPFPPRVVSMPRDGEPYYLPILAHW